MANAWKIADHPPTHPDCFVVLSYAVKDRTTPTRATCAEIELACRWWQRFPKAVLIMSTGDNQGLGVTNAQVMSDYAVQLGVPPECVLQEDRSRNTYENLLYSRQIIDANGFRQPTLVTLDLFTRRAVAIAHKLGWRDFYWLSVYAPGDSAYGYKRLFTSSRATTFAYELLAYVYGKIVGWI